MTECKETSKLKTETISFEGNIHLVQNLSSSSSFSEYGRR